MTSKCTLLKIMKALIPALFIHNHAAAQQPAFPDFGEFTKEEISMKHCPFDKDAAAVVLLDEAISDYDDARQLITEHHVKIKIFNKKGFEFANVSIPFYRGNGFETISDVYALEYNEIPGTDGEKNWVDTNSVYTTDKTGKYGFVTFAFPEIKTGSIIEYRYKSTMLNYSGLEEWVFQQEIPVMVSKYSLHMLPDVEFSYLVNKKASLDLKITPEPKKGKVYFEMNNIPALVDEPEMDARKDYLQKVIFQLSGVKTGTFSRINVLNDWANVIARLNDNEHFGGQLHKNIPKTGEFIKSVRLLSSPEEKMKAVFNYVRSNMSWNGVHETVGDQGVKEAWKKQSGSDGDINMILVNLLRDADLDAYPLLVSERFNGKIYPAYPFMEQFNSLYAWVNTGTKSYYLDAADRFTPAAVIPFDILNTNALLVKKDGGGIVPIPDNQEEYRELVNIFMNLDAAGNASGEVLVKSGGYAGIMKKQAYFADSLHFSEKYFHADGLKTEEFKIEIPVNDSLDIETGCKFKLAVRGTGSYRYLPLNLFSGFENNPFLADTRFSSVNYGCRKNIILSTGVSLPAVYSVDGKIAPTKLTYGDGDIVVSRTVDIDKTDNSVLSVVNIKFNKTLFTVNEYPDLQAFYKKLTDLLKEPLLLKKK